MAKLRSLNLKSSEAGINTHINKSDYELPSALLLHLGNVMVVNVVVAKLINVDSLAVSG